MKRLFDYEETRRFDSKCDAEITRTNGLFHSGTVRLCNIRFQYEALEPGSVLKSSEIEILQVCSLIFVTIGNVSKDIMLREKNFNASCNTLIHSTYIYSTSRVLFLVLKDQTSLCVDLYTNLIISFESVRKVTHRLIFGYRGPKIPGKRRHWKVLMVTRGWSGLVTADRRSQRICEASLDKEKVRRYRDAGKA